jgi:hypothetical protein
VIVRRAPGVLERRFAGEVLLTAHAREEVDRLDGTAAVVWALLDEPRSVEELVDELSEAYSVSRTEVETGLRSLLDDLLARSYAEVVDA